jgi:putative ABC transport system permease protein
LLSLFSFPLVKGDPKTALLEKNSLIISESMSRKYFGDEDPVGKVMDIDGYTDYVVTGVARDVPLNSHLKFDFLLSYATYIYWRGDDAETSWTWHDFYSYVLLYPGADPHEVERKLAKTLEREQSERVRRGTGKDQFLLQPVTDIHLYSHLTMEFGDTEQGSSNAVNSMSLIAVLILGIAWINYINLTTARSVKRSREVGVRKTIGARRIELINQFMLESVVMNATSFIVGLMIVVLGIRQFNVLTHATLTTDFLLHGEFWVFAFLVLAIGTVVSGLYPAFVLSSFNPITALKGAGKSIGTGVFLRRALVVVQFACSDGVIQVLSTFHGLHPFFRGSTSLYTL